ncbi:hypothetical protein BHE74_00037791 [Ensete ventricosum]|nr:hypothetical protein BHE74_00037791 [Ensete ventricosum]
MASLLLSSLVNSSSCCALNPRLLSTPPSPLRRHFCTAARTRRRFRRRPPVGDGMASPSAASLPPPLRRMDDVGGRSEGYDEEEAALQPLEPDIAEVEAPSFGPMMGGARSAGPSSRLGDVDLVHKPLWRWRGDPDRPLRHPNRPSTWSLGLTWLPPKCRRGRPPNAGLDESDRPIGYPIILSPPQEGSSRDTIRFGWPRKIGRGDGDTPGELGPRSGF